jgi:hypothetical protein
VVGFPAVVIQLTASTQYRLSAATDRQPIGH